MNLPPGYAPIRATARLLGCSHPTLIDALNTGRIPEAACVRGPKGQRIGLHIEQARLAMVENTDPAQSARKGLNWDAVPPQGVAPAAVPVEAEGASYSEARAERERAQAALAQLDLAKQLGQVVLAETVAKGATAAARATRDALLSIPDRVAALVAAETDPARVHAILSNELRQALHGLADRLAAEPG
jgi:hypothetical protein